MKIRRLGGCEHIIIIIIVVVKKTSQFKTVCKDNSGYIIQLKQQKSTAHRDTYVTSNITFLIFAVLVV